MSVSEKKAMQLDSLSQLSGVSSVGVFGGTFDPVHNGHLILAERAREELALDAVLFMPANVPPHKATVSNIAPPQARLDMIRLAIESNPHFYAIGIELDRAGVSYTVESLRELARVLAGTRLTLLIGSDNARDFTSWREPEEIVQLASVAVWERPGSYFWPEVLPDYIAQRISSPLIEISSTEIRNRIATGKSIRYLTSDPVVQYIQQHGIYR